MSLPDTETLKTDLAAATNGVGMNGRIARLKFANMAEDMAAEVIRLRDMQVAYDVHAERSRVLCLACGPVTECDEDRCCRTCGCQLIDVCDSDAADVIAEWEADHTKTVKELTAERDAARQEAEGLRVKLAFQEFVKLGGDPGGHVATLASLQQKDQKIAMLERQLAIARMQGFGSTSDDGGEWLSVAEMREVE